jgi:hypothetical protein
MADFDVGDEQVRDIDATLTALAEHAEPIKLCFTNHWEDDDERPALLSAALMGSLASKQVTVDAKDEHAVDGLLRFGVATALSQRSAEVTSFIGRTERLNREQLRTLWTPAALSATQALFADEDPDPTDAFGPLHATFLNPQLASAADGRPDVVYLVRRWLTKRLLGRASMNRAEVKGFVHVVATAVDETVRNVREHAASHDIPSPSCLLRISLESEEQIRCSTLDTGVGVARSLEDRHIEPDLGKAERLEKLMKNEIPGWDAGRGTGLAFITERILNKGGRITVATDSIRVRGGTGDIAVTEDGFPLQGTVVDCTIPLS